MSKKTTTLYLDENLIARCKELNINISKTCNRILRMAVENPVVHEEEILLGILLSESEKLKRRKEDLTHEIGQLSERQEYINSRIARQRELVREVHRSDEIAFLIRALNQRIVDAEFDKGAIEESSGDIIAKLQEYNLPITPDWLTKQIERVKRLQA